MCRRSTCGVVGFGGRGRRTEGAEACSEVLLGLPSSKVRASSRGVVRLLDPWNRLGDTSGGLSPTTSFVIVGWSSSRKFDCHSGPLRLIPCLSHEVSREKQRHATQRTPIAYNIIPPSPPCRL